jgi:hypothetical protein
VYLFVWSGRPRPLPLPLLLLLLFLDREHSVAEGRIHRTLFADKSVRAT